MRTYIILLLLTYSNVTIAQQRDKSAKAIFLEDISWTEAQKALTSDAVVVIPLGAGAKEHGPHLPLSTDYIQAEASKKIIALHRKVIITPTINYGFYPAFTKYAGSTTNFWHTSRDLILQIIRGLSKFGPKRFYIINIGVSTTSVIKSAAKILRNEGVLLYYSDYSRSNYIVIEDKIKTKEFGGHADEIETSNILFLRPDLVHMNKAVDDSSIKSRKGIMTPVPLPGGAYNPTGVNGYATLANKQKGKLYMKYFVNEMIKEIDSISSCNLPLVKDNLQEFKIYEGYYTDSSGNKLTISQEDNHLYYIWNDHDQRKFFPLYYEEYDWFSSMYLTILFMRNEKNEIVKAYCRLGDGKIAWVTKNI